MRHPAPRRCPLAPRRLPPQRPSPHVPPRPFPPSSPRRPPSRPSQRRLPPRALALPLPRRLPAFHRRFPAASPAAARAGSRSSRARHGPHVPLGHELGVGALHGDEAHPEMLRERALRRQLRVCRDGARLDVAPDAAVEVAVQAFLAAILERIREHAASLPFRSPPPSLPRCAWRSMVHISLRAFRLPRSAFCAPRFVPRVWPCIWPYQVYRFWTY